MARNDKREGISKEMWEKKYHEAQAEIHSLRSQLVSADTSKDAIIDELEGLADREKGYGRWGRSLNGHYWVRWKWTAGPLQGRYAIGGHSTLAYAFLACLADVSMCERGKKEPPLDVGYKKG